MSVTPGSTLYLEVGGKGDDQTSGQGNGGVNGGGSDGYGLGSGGGGASDVRTAPAANVGSLDTRLVVAGGGGGSGSYGSGVTQGGSAGLDGQDGPANSGGGGKAGTQTDGGAPGADIVGVATGGSKGQGGKSSFCSGGGGGGLYGGGGGGSTQGACGEGFGAGGGGGGSSLVPTGGTFALAADTTVTPQIVITFITQNTNHAPAIAIRSGACGTALTTATLTLLVTDPDGDTTTLSITGNTNPAATTNPTVNGSNLSVGAGQPGARTILTLTASDGTASTERKFAVVNGKTGAGAISTTATNSIVFAGTGAKKITTGGLLGDTVCGSSGNDTITTGPGYDYVFAGPGNDTVKLGPGNDRVTGGTGADTVDGGTGTDVFADYSAAQGDRRTNVP